MSRAAEHLVTADLVRHIVANMRERDRREIFALRWNDDEDQLVSDICALAGDLWRVWTWDGWPVAIAGLTPVRPGVAIAGAFGTPQWHRVIRAMTIWALKFAVPVVATAGFHRIEAYVLAVNTDADARGHLAAGLGRWIEMLGGTVEAQLKAYGRAREDFLLYARVLDPGEGRDVSWRRGVREYRPSHDLCDAD